MSQLSKFSYYFAIITLFFTLSCKKDEDTLPACGCNGPIYEKVVDKEASYLGNGYFIIGNTANNDTLKYGWACQEDTTLQKSPNQNSRDYIISCSLKKSCPANDVVFPAENFGIIDMIEVTAIRRK